MKKLRIGVIGLGARGYYLTKNLFPHLSQGDIVAVCDRYEDRVKAAADLLVEAGFPRPFETTDYRKLIDRELVDCILIISSWDSHVEITLACMEAGIPVGCEVGGAYTLDDCYRLVETYERTRTPYMFLENCNYGKRELMVLNMMKAGLLGEVVHCSGGYCHDLREEVANGKENRHYRLHEYSTRNCEQYPSHELGPIMQVLGIHHGNRLVSLSSTPSRSAGLHEYCQKHKADDSDLRDRVFTQGDIITTVLTCEHGETVVLTLDTTLPRAYSRGFTVRGTKGAYFEDTDSVFLDGKDNDKDFCWHDAWGNAADYEEEYLDERWKNVTPEMEAAGHGGMDYLCYGDFLDHVLSCEPMPIDVYDGALIMAITPLSEQSIQNGGVPVTVPDFKNRC